MSLTPLSALSPVDGRYASRCVELRELFSEGGLIRARVRVEAAWLQTLAQQSGIPELDGLTGQDLAALQELVARFSPAEAAEVKQLERETNHDVKAVEYFIKRRLAAHPGWSRRVEFVHFACTSEDINNLAYALLCKQARDGVLLPRLQTLVDSLRGMAHAHADDAMMSRTHGQPATPTTLGKEVAVFAHRLREQVSGFAGVLWTLRFASARYDSAIGMELFVVTIVLLGGVSIFGGRGTIAGVVLAVAVLGCLQTALTADLIPAQDQNIVVGGLLLASVIVPNLGDIFRRTRARLQTAGARRHAGSAAHEETT